MTLTMLIFGLALLAITIIGLWLCLPGKDHKVKPYLRGGADVLAAIMITCGLGVGTIVFIAGVVKF
jgi:hypothetical protein